MNKNADSINHSYIILITSIVPAGGLALIRAGPSTGTAITKSLFLPYTQTVPGGIRILHKQNIQRMLTGHELTTNSA